MADISSILVNNTTTDINKINLNGVEYNLVKGSSVTYRTESVSKSQYGNKWTWINFSIPVPSGTIGIVSISYSGGTPNCAMNSISLNGTTLSASVFTHDSGRTITISASVLIKNE